MRSGNILSVIMRIKTLVNIERVTDIPLFCYFTFEDVDKMHSW